MKKNLLLISLIIASSFATYFFATYNPNHDKVVVVWSSEDEMVAKRVVLPYVTNAKKKGWFKDVTLMVWGPSANTIATNKELQTLLKDAKDAGVYIEACLACADAYGVTPTLENLGFDMKYIGVPLATYLKTGYNLLTF